MTYIKKITSIYLFLFSTNLFSNSLEKLTIGTFYGDINALMYIAKEKGFFQVNGLDVNLKPYPAGKFSVKDMLENKFDYAMSTEFIPVKNSLKRDDFEIITAIGKAVIEGIIVRKDSNIKKISDIKNKRVGVSLGTVSEYYLSRILKYYNIKPEEIKIINVHPINIENALMSNSVDAMITWEPNLYQLKTNYPNRLSYLQTEEGYPYYSTLSVNKSKQAKSSLTSKKILKSLIEAQTWSKSNPIKLKNFLKRTFHLKDDYLDSILKNYTLEVSIPKGLINLVNTQLKWIGSKQKAETLINFNFTK